ncbi:MAG: multicopper oxidase domain-containing protein [Crocinitomicaceae bacterium]
MIRFALALLFFNSLSFSATISEKLFIVSDSIQAFDGSKFPYTTFNSSLVFEQSNPLLEVFQDDSLLLWVVNKDDVSHDFEIKGKIGAQTIAPNDSIYLPLKMEESGVFIYRDPSLNDQMVYLGLGGSIIVKDHNHPSFSWNIREHDSLWNVQIKNSGTVNWSNYNPKYFTINGVSNPLTNADAQARITGSIGDTIILYISNCGKSIHSIHFHGYHAVILSSSAHPFHQGREKDTFPIESQETLILRIVPDKSGEYPVHDHNLIAVSGNNIYPNGMFLTMLISP